MRTVVPFGAAAPKTRLDGALGPDERAAFARAMLRDVLDALEATSHPTSVEVLSTAPVDLDVPVTVDERPLTPAVNDRLESATDPLAVVMADLPLATPAALARLFEADGDVVLAPGRGGGTNGLVVRHPDVRVDYHGASVRDHREAAAAAGATVAEVDSFRLATDVDETGDLPEVLLHSSGAAAAWLRDAGFELATGDGRVRAVRD
ncbi:MAG: 2-phospho-L-lactate guanylyltransferase [Halorientalis sp.]